MDKRSFYSRRELLSRLGVGIGGLAFADLLSRDGLLASGRAQEVDNPLAPKPPPLTPRATAVISIFCYGGVSQIGTWDPKPDLVKWQGETMQGVGEIKTIMGNPGGLMPSPWTFAKHGASGMEVSELFPHVAEHVDDIALIRSISGEARIDFLVTPANELGAQFSPDGRFIAYVSDESGQNEVYVRPFPLRRRVGRSPLTVGARPSGLEMEKSSSTAREPP